MCTIPGIPGLDSGTTVARVEEIQVTTEAFPSTVREGRTVDVRFTVEDIGTAPLMDVTILAFDKCVFQGDDLRQLGEIRTTQIKTTSFTWTAGDVSVERDCNVRFRTQYSGIASTSLDVIVLTETEFKIREQSGTLANLQPNVFTTPNPLKVTLTFSEGQPLIFNQQVNLLIDYISSGGGLVDVKSGDITIDVPANLVFVDCDTGDYSFSNNKLVLSRDLIFIKGKAARSICTFDAFASQPVDVRSLSVASNYRYMLDGSILLKVLPTTVGNVSIPPPPPPAFTVDFTWSPTSPKVGETTTFSGTVSGDNPASLDWDFGDGVTDSNTFAPTHTYTATGNYTVSFTVRGVISGKTVKAEKIITVR